MSCTDWNIDCPVDHAIRIDNIHEYIVAAQVGRHELASRYLQLLLAVIPGVSDRRAARC